LPSSDYPASAGYVSPGVILMVNDMKEVELKGRDKFVATDVTVSVTCKPKHIYPSSATNWANDLVACRYRFCNEHEVPSTSESKNNITIRDSLFQFELMTIKEDYEKVVEGGDHLSRELLRVEVLLKRVNVCLMETAEDLKQESVIGKMFADLSLLADQLKDIDNKLKSQTWKDLHSSYLKAKSMCQEIRREIVCIGIPQHRPLDIQSSDAGPGVSTHEQMSQLRMAEYFMINNLDLQCRLHYAPYDSSTHIVERVMRSLNECLGDGRAIPVPSTSLVDSEGKFKMTALTNEEIQRIHKEDQVRISKDCAEQVKKRFNGKSCMGTSIHANTPWYQEYQCFFFDEWYMTKCASASSKSVLEQCAGKEYYKFVKNFFEDHYMLYDNGFEGIRSGCQEKQGVLCDFHKYTEKKDVLACVWSGIPVTRVQPPVPDCSFTDVFHYALPNDISCGNITEKFGLKKEHVMDISQRAVDDFSPRKQLERLINSCGDPDFIVHDDVSNDCSTDSVHAIIDKNETLSKMLAEVDNFVPKYAGEDLRETVVAEIKRR
ncbi:unnamed protein product, partial [Porites evermanni]